MLVVDSEQCAANPAKGWLWSAGQFALGMFIMDTYQVSCRLGGTGIGRMGEGARGGTSLPSTCSSMTRTSEFQTGGSEGA